MHYQRSMTDIEFQPTRSHSLMRKKHIFYKLITLKTSGVWNRALKQITGASL